MTPSLINIYVLLYMVNMQFFEEHHLFYSTPSNMPQTSYHWSKFHRTLGVLQENNHSQKWHSTLELRNTHPLEYFTRYPTKKPWVFHEMDWEKWHENPGLTCRNVLERIHIPRSIRYSSGWPSASCAHFHRSLMWPCTTLLFVHTWNLEDSLIGCEATGSSILFFLRNKNNHK